MPRPNKSRRLISVYLAESGVSALDDWALEHGVTRSEAIRALLSAAMATPAALRLAERKATTHTVVP